MPLCACCSSLVLNGGFLFCFNSFRPFEILQVKVKVYCGLGGHFLSNCNFQMQQFPHVHLLCYQRKKKKAKKPYKQPKTKQKRNHSYKNNTFSKDNITKNTIPTTE